MSVTEYYDQNVGYGSLLRGKGSIKEDTHCDGTIVAIEFAVSCMAVSNE